MLIHVRLGRFRTTGTSYGPSAIAIEENYHTVVCSGKHANKFTFSWHFNASSSSLICILLICKKTMFRMERSDLQLSKEFRQGGVSMMLVGAQISLSFERVLGLPSDTEDANWAILQMAVCISMVHH